MLSSVSTVLLLAIIEMIYAERLVTPVTGYTLHITHS